MNVIEELTRSHLLSVLLFDGKKFPIEAVIFGTGQICDDFLSAHQGKIDVKEFFDNTIDQEEKFGSPVVKPYYTREIDQHYAIFIASSEYDIISKQLNELGYKNFYHRLNAQSLITPITPFLINLTHELFLSILSEMKELSMRFAVLESADLENPPPTFDIANFHLFADGGVMGLLLKHQEKLNSFRDNGPNQVVAVHPLNDDYETRVVKLLPDSLIQRLIDSSKEDYIYHQKIESVDFNKVGRIFYDCRLPWSGELKDYRMFPLDTDREKLEKMYGLTDDSWMDLELCRAYERQMFFLGFDTILMRNQLVHYSDRVDPELIFVILRDSCSRFGLAEKVKSFFVDRGLGFGCHISLSRSEKRLLKNICRGGNWSGSIQEKLSGDPDEILVLVDETPQISKYFLDEKSPLFYRRNAILNLKNELRRRLNFGIDSPDYLNFFHISDDEFEAFQYVTKIKRLRCWILEFLGSRPDLP